MLLFSRQFLKHSRDIGSVIPSSRFLAEALAKNIRSPRKPMRILEVGAGTGVVTRSILKRLIKGDELHVVELNPEFCRVLEENLLQRFRAARPDITIHLHCCPVEEAPLDGEFDAIISGLPFSNFPTALVRKIFRRLLNLLGVGGELSYYGYVGMTVIRGSFFGPQWREKSRRLRAISRGLRRRYAGRREVVIGNVPPAFTIRLTRLADEPRSRRHWSSRDPRGVPTPR